MAQIEPLNLFGAISRGRNQAIAERQANEESASNKLRDMYMANQERRQQTAFEANQHAVTGERASAAAPMIGKLARDILSSGDVRGNFAAAAKNPQVQRLFADVGITPDQMDFNDPELETDLQQWARFAEQGKQGPSLNVQEGPQGSSIITYGDTLRVLEQPTRQQEDKPVLTDVVLPDGSVQKQWVRPGQAQGTPVGASRPQESGPSMRDVTSLRKEFESTDAAKNYRAVLPLFNRAQTAPNTRAGDISLIYALGKMFDPTSVVREGELVLAQNAAPWLQKMASNANSQISAKGALSPETRAVILDALRGQVESFKIPYDQERERYSQYATEYGIDPFKVVGNDAAAGFDAPKGAKDARIPNGVAIRNTSKSGRPIVSRDGGATWEYEDK